jgi:hypothetical protein
LRSGIKLSKEEDDQKSPIFVQWLDAVFQLVHQFPEMFEFNENLIFFLAKHYHSLLYGTFLFNNEFHRKDNKAHNITRSIWSDVFIMRKTKIKNDNSVSLKEDFLNKKYMKKNSLKYNNSLMLQKKNYYIMNGTFENSNLGNIQNNNYKPNLNKILRTNVLEDILFPEHGIKHLVVWEQYFASNSEVISKIINGEYFKELEEPDDNLNDILDIDDINIEKKLDNNIKLYVSHSSFSLVNLSIQKIDEKNSEEIKDLNNKENFYEENKNLLEISQTSKFDIFMKKNCQKDLKNYHNLLSLENFSFEINIYHKRCKDQNDD